MSAIFISHSSHDNAWAERIRDWLKGGENKQNPEHRYQSLFLDFDPDQGIPVGRSWRETLYEKLRLCRAVIVIGSAAYAASEWCLAELGVALASGKLLLPVRIDDSAPLSLLSETQRTPLVPIDLHPASLEGWRRLEQGLQALSWQERLAWPPEEAPDASPFPGLSAFDRQHAPVFFGQDDVRETVQTAIRRLTARQSRLLLILGASGCGKSSLLRAGILPWLEGEEPGRWIVLDPFRPDKDPLAALAVVLERAHQALRVPPPGAPATTARSLDQRFRALRLRSGRQDARVVLAIDQFEELLGRGDGRDPQEAAAAIGFLSLLAELLAEEGSQLLLLATLRSDFLGSLQLHPSRLDRWAGDPILLGPLDVDGFRRVIEGPAQRVGLRLEEGLSDRLVRDTATGDALPLLAFTLRELWDGRAADGAITLEQYKRTGGLEGAVQRSADAAIAASGASEEELEALRRAFIDHLLRLSGDGLVAKQPARWEDVPQASHRLLRRLVEARLLVAGKGEASDQVEIAHEALLRTWPLLVGWIVGGREELLQRLRAKRLAADLAAEAPRQRRQALADLAALAAAGGAERQAVATEGREELTQLLANPAAEAVERSDAALVLALVGAEAPLSRCLADGAVPVALRRRAAESLGLLAQRSGDPAQRERIQRELEAVLRGEPLDVRIAARLDQDRLERLDPAFLRGLVEQARQELGEAFDRARQSGQFPEDVSEEQVRQALEQAVQQQVLQGLQAELWASGQAPGWAEHDARLPLLQGAARGLQLALAADLPLLGKEPVHKVPMLVLTALEEEGGLRITTEVVQRDVWRLPLPAVAGMAPQQLELVAIPGGEHPIGSPSDEAGRDIYPRFRQGCDRVDVEAERTVRLEPYWLVRHPISQAQWQAVVEATLKEERGPLQPRPGSFRPEPEELWERHGQPGALPVDTVSWNDCRQWLDCLNGWLRREWAPLGGEGVAPQLALPSESQWEAACRAGGGTPFHFGATLDAAWARYNATFTFGMGRRGENDRRPAVIGFSGLVNRWGLADLHGQLQEWCADRWHPNPLGKERPATSLDGQAWEDKDPSLAAVPQEQEMRLLRGGSWILAPHIARAAMRSSYLPDYFDASVGVRPGCFSPPGWLLYT